MPTGGSIIGLDRFVAAENVGRPEDQNCAEPPIAAMGLNTSVQEATKLSFSRENLDRLHRHISRLNEIIARQEARARRLGWPGIIAAWRNEHSRGDGD